MKRASRFRQRRYDDTDLILRTIAEAGCDSEEGKRAIRRMNRLHRRFDISNEDFLYVLSTFVYEPIRWNARTSATPTRTRAWRRRHATCSSPWFPGVPKQIARYAIAALMDERLREAIGFHVRRARRKPKQRTKLTHRTYPRGYEIEALGPMPPDAA